MHTRTCPHRNTICEISCMSENPKIQYSATFTPHETDRQKPCGACARVRSVLPKYVILKLEAMEKARRESKAKAAASARSVE